MQSSNTLKLALLTLSMPTLVVLATSSPASAACTVGGAKTSTSTTVYANSCYRGQARITRYVGGSQGVVDYYSIWSQTTATVSNGSGSDAGHAVRGGDAPGGAIGPWGSF